MTKKYVFRLLVSCYEEGNEEDAVPDVVEVKVNANNLKEAKRQFGAGVEQIVIEKEAKQKLSELQRNLTKQTSRKYYGTTTSDSSSDKIKYHHSTNTPSDKVNSKNWKINQFLFFNSKKSKT
jgi:hypothetical protein